MLTSLGLHVTIEEIDACPIKTIQAAVLDWDGDEFMPQAIAKYQPFMNLAPTEPNEQSTDGITIEPTSMQYQNPLQFAEHDYHRVQPIKSRTRFS